MAIFFITIYFVLFSLPFPWYFRKWNFYDKAMDAVVLRAGKLFGLVVPVTKMSGSGDKVYDYVKAACLLASSFLATVLWVSFGSPDFSDWMAVYVKYYLVSVMLSYGAAKVIPTQFTKPSLARLLQPIGDVTPMALMWTFMGYSPTYVVFTGLVEMLGGILLAFPQTSFLGALVCSAVLLHVVVLNVAYDVCVKLFSLHLFLASVFFVALDGEKLLGLLGDGGVAWTVASAAFVSVFAFLGLRRSYQSSKMFLKSPLYGVWRVREESPWRRVVFNCNPFMSAQLADGSMETYFVETSGDRIAVADRYTREPLGVLNYVKGSEELVSFEGTVGGDRREFTVVLEKVNFRLMDNKMHLITEYPNNK